MIQVYDSEIVEIERVLTLLNSRQGTAVNLDGFRREAIDRFHKIGFVVDVKTFSTNVSGTWAFDIDIQDRVNSQEFDHDRMVHEVTNDILDLGTKGVIKSTKEEIKNALEIERTHKRHE